MTFLNTMVQFLFCQLVKVFSTLLKNRKGSGWSYSIQMEKKGDYSRYYK
jgi:hypothetical protein